MNLSNLPTRMLLMGGAALLLATLSAKADTTLLVLNSPPDGTPTPGTGGAIENYVIGVAFIPQENITVTELGAYAGDFLNGDDKTTQDFTAVLYSFTGGGSANGGDGATESGSGTVLDNAIIATNTPVNADDVAFTSVSPILLKKGDEYFIGADGGTPTTYDTSDADYLQKGLGSANYNANSDFFVTPDASQVVLYTSGYSSPQPVAPGVSSGALSPGATQAFNLSNAYFAGDLQYVVGSVPEPSDLAYLVLGGAILFIALRRKSAGFKI